MRALVLGVRIDSGVIVVAQAPGFGTVDTGLQPGDVIHSLNRTSVESVEQLKSAAAQLKTGDAWRITSGGGGGYGSPFDRPAEDVREDVYQGYVSVKAAAELYGVVIDPVTYAIDRAATERARSGAAAARRKVK